MSIQHHLTDETLQDYAAGALSTPMEVVVACHLTLCPSCRSRAEFVEAVGGIELHHAESVKPAMSAKQLLESCGTQTSLDPVHKCGSTDSGDAKLSGWQTDKIVNGVPRPLGRLLDSDLEHLEWSRIAPGIKQHNLSNQHRRYGAFKLLHLSPGVVLSEHTHQDRELTLVLRGSYQDEVGRFKAGDVADLDQDVIHQPVVDTDEPCIALIATQSPVRYSGMLGRLIQPFVGI